MKLIITEKDQQAQDLASALGVSPSFVDVIIPNKEYLGIKSKIETKKRQIARKELAITEIENTYTEKGKEYVHLKKYTSLVNKKTEYEVSLIALKNKLDIIKNKLETKRDKIYQNEEITIVACTGHLIELKFNNEGNENGELNFETELKEPSPISEAFRYMKFMVIKKFFKRDDIESIICATDYDREGQSIFGNLIEYFNIDFDLCERMKFSTLEAEVLKRAYNNPIPFDQNFYASGKVRAWSDFVIGYNLSPILAVIYRNEYIEPYLNSIGLLEEDINKIKYKNTFHIGRVKLVILKYIYDYTKEQVNKSTEIENEELEEELEEDHRFYFRENGIRHYLFDFDWVEKHKEGFDIDEDFDLEITKIDFNEVEKAFPSYEPIDVPSFLNMTKVYQICANLGASTEEVTKAIQYLYSEKYTSYPRTKSEKWEIEDEEDRTEYAHSVLKALENCGYPVKEYYYEGYGKEGDKTHSHPCIHPLPSITPERLDDLRRVSPFAYIVLNEIIIHTLKCFEKLALVNEQTVHFKMLQGDMKLKFNKSYNIEILESNLLDFEGIYDSGFSEQLNVNEGDVFDIEIENVTKKRFSLGQNRSELKMLSDFDVIEFLNENDIGTEATRSGLLTELINLQYLVSRNILLTTFFGNTLHKISKKFIKFIDIQYTLQIEEYLNGVENGSLDIEDFKKIIEEGVTETYNNIIENKDRLKELFSVMPICKKHNIPMVVNKGTYGRFIQCPYYYTEEEKCDESFSI